MANPGWYPDPMGRYEYRYHNGATWTGDVAHAGTRFVDPLGIGGPAAGSVAPGQPVARGNGIAVAAATCGIVSLALGWIPVVFAIGAVLAVLALVFGAIGLRRSRVSQHGRGFAVTGLVTGALGLLVAVGGLVFTIAVFRALDRYESPEPHTTGPVACTLDDGRVDGVGEITNLGDSRADFTVSVTIRRSASGFALATVRVDVDDVQPGEVREYRFVRRVDTSPVDCEVTAVDGPLPFGVVVD